MKYGRNIWFLGVSLCLLQHNADAQVPKKYQEDAKTIIAAIDNGGDKVTKQELKNYLEEKFFKSLDADNNKVLDTIEIRRNKLHCLRNDTNTILTCENASPRFNYSVDIVNLAYLSNNHDSWQAIFSGATEHFFSTNQYLDQNSLANQLFAIEDRKSWDKLKVTFDNYLSQTNDNDLAIAKIMWDKLFLTIDQNGSDTIDQFEYETHFPGMFDEFFVLTNADKMDGELATISRKFLVGGSTFVGPMVLSAQRIVPSLMAKYKEIEENHIFSDTTDLTNVRQALAAQHAEIENTIQSASNDEENFFAQNYDKNYGLSLYSGKSRKAEKVKKRNKDETQLYFRVLKDHTKYDGAEKAAELAWQKTDGSNETNADIALRLDFYSPLLRNEYDEVRVSSGLGYKRSGNLPKSSVNDEKFLFLNYSRLHDYVKDDNTNTPNWLARANMTASLVYSDQETRELKKDENAAENDDDATKTLVTNLDKLSLNLIYEPVLVFTNYNIGERNLMNENPDLYTSLKPTFGAVVDKINAVDYSFIPSDEKDLLKTFKYAYLGLTYKVKPSEHFTLSVSRVKWKAFDKEREGFKYDNIILTYVIPNNDNITVSITYSHGIEKPDNNDQEILKLGFNILL